MNKTVAVLSAMSRSLLEPRLPEWVSPRWFTSTEELFEHAPDAEIGWFDLYKTQDMAQAMKLATGLKWLNSVYAGLDGFPLDLLRERGTVVTNGAGINAITIAEYVVMGMLTIAKGYREVVHAQDRHEWLMDSPGKVELAGSRALLLGYGAIGQRVEQHLRGFDVEVTAVRRTPGPQTLGPNEWRARLGEFDWVILAVPATADTERMIGAEELAAMKTTAAIVNVARGTVIDQEALVAALTEKRIGAAFLDVTTPEPLPADHALWSLPNAHITMHLSGRAQDRMFQRAVDRFVKNLARFQAGETLQPKVDLTAGY
ncbi:D-2-hydroxyacid dehydrogenase [Novosphingobium tardum]|uniref:D-2-hydroxyacid dehydrogenase n=1 Tax=Novosphingobium tardum TaxID=1538021 RepID=A0ABV8RN25_9SPHN